MKNHILLVEDNRQLRQSLRPRLEKYYHVNEVSEGRSAILMASETIPDLIISDIAIRDMDGIEFCKIMKRQMETTHIPFIIMSAYDEPSLKMQGMESGADHYFSRPLSIDLLLVTIRNIFARDMKLKHKYTGGYLFGKPQPVPVKNEKAFHQKLQDLIEENIEDPALDVDFICKNLGVSRSKLYQIVKLSSDHSVGELIRRFRLKKAVQLMVDKDLSVNEVVNMIGFQSSSNFSRAFKKEYGKPPLQYIQAIRKTN
ncbi:response regulator [Pedobacter miscanthi]|uniref:response regulator transcription factor n=1 Tax=Pedobacter miscanthi TaxID=2259170 RepID=UPI00292EF486|nr:response regulator [Pedobacter miscanthi]